MFTHPGAVMCQPPTRVRFAPSIHTHGWYHPARCHSPTSTPNQGKTFLICNLQWNKPFVAQVKNDSSVVLILFIPPHSRYHNTAMETEVVPRVWWRDSCCCFQVGWLMKSQLMTVKRLACSVEIDVKLNSGQHFHQTNQINKNKEKKEGDVADYHVKHPEA